MLVSIAFCANCGSRTIDVIGWEGTVAKTHCSRCDAYGYMVGVTLGRAEVDEKVLTQASTDRAYNKSLERRGEGAA